MVLRALLAILELAREPQIRLMSRRGQGVLAIPVGSVLREQGIGIEKLEYLQLQLFISFQVILLYTRTKSSGYFANFYAEKLLFWFISILIIVV